MSANTDQDADELENGNGHDTLPDLLKPDASRVEIIRAVNGLALEMQFIRESYQQLGGRLATMDGKLDKIITSLSKKR